MGAPPDGADDPLFAGSGEMAALMRAKDWSTTSLGPPSTWPGSLRTVVRILLTSRFAMWMGWGSELSFFYNDAYRPTLGTKHAWALGAPARRVWAEIWPAIGPRIDLVLRSGEATWDASLLLFLERSGYPEETYHTFSYSPLPDDAGVIVGMLCVVSEETERVIGERRLALLRDLAAGLASSNTTDEVFAAVERCLARDAHDLTFALAYLFEDGGARARLCARANIPGGHPAAPASLDVDAPGAVWPARDVWSRGATVTVERPPGAAPWPPGAWVVAPTHALVVPIAQQGQAQPAGAFIAGLNPHRVLDDAYRDFVRLFVGQIAAGLANAHAYEAERRRAEALAELDRAKTAFFSNVSHEFRTPLTLMIGPLADMARAAGLPPEHRESLALVQRNGLRLLKLVNTMLDFSRIEAGRIKARYEPVDLAEYTADLASVFRAATDKAGLALRVDCPPVGEPVYVDRDMWEKIVLNLVSNAFKFTLSGEIAVSLRREGRHVRLAVSDTGAGVPPHELPHLFERFHRVEGARGRTHEGTGIGLALVQELARLHGGAVHAESELGRGSTFSVTVPLGSSHLPPDRIVGAAPAPAARGPNAFVEEALRWLPEPAGGDGGALDEPAEVTGRASRPSVEGPRERVLLADDNADMRDYIRRLLGARWDVEAVGNGAEALRAAQRRRPDVVITDVMMPELDGFGLLRELRADPRTRDVPVLMLSARAGEEARVEGLRSGANDYLVKPFSARELAARVETQLLRQRVRAAEEARRRVEMDDLARARHEAEVANRAKDEFMAMLGHELRNPLAPILTALQIMRLRGPDTDDRERAVIERQIKHLVGLVDDLLDVSRVTQGKVQLKRERVELADVVARAIEMASPLLEQNRHDLRVEVARHGLAVHGDAGRLAQVVANLLTNAAKYTPPGGRVSVEARAEGAEVVLTVRDTGIGIERDMLPRVFDLFAQEGQALDRSLGGLGLGLAIVRSLVALHGGAVAARSDGKDRGAEFTVRLPRLDPDAASPEGRASDAKALRPAHEGARRVLVVDDNVDAAEMLAESLNLCGFVTACAHDGPSAIQLAESFDPDVAVLDLGLPVMDGFELARRFTEHASLRRARLVALTGYGQEQDRRRSAAAGFHAHLVKPVDLDKLRAVIERLGGGA